MEIRVLDTTITSVSRPLPNIASESRDNSGILIYQEYSGKNVIRLAFTGSRRDNQISFSPTESTPDSGIIPLQSVEKRGASVVLTDFGRDYFSAPSVSERYPQLPLISFREIKSGSSGNVIATASIKFRGIWPKKGRFVIAYGRSLLDKATNALEPYGMIVPRSTASRVLRNIATPEMHVFTDEGGTIAEEYISDLAIQHMLDRMFDQIGCAMVSIKADVPEGNYSQDVSIVDDSIFLRDIGLVSP